MGSAISVFRIGLSALAALAVCATLFSDLMPISFGGYADQRFLQVFISGVLVVGAILLLLLQPHEGRRPIFSSLAPFTLLSLSFPVLSIAFSGEPYIWVEPGMYAFYFFALGSAGVAVASSGATLGYSQLLAILAAASCCLYGAMSINVYLFALFDGVTDLVDFLPWGFVNIRYWSHVATWFLPLLPLAVLVGPFKSHRLWRVLVGIGAGLWWWMLFLSVARGSMLGLLFGVVIVVLLVGRQSLPWVKLFVRYMLFGVLIWLVLSVIIPSFLAEEVQVRSVSTDSAGRMPLFIEAWSMSLQSFPFGMGPQSWLTHEVLTEAYRSSRKFGHPHNMYLLWAAEYGWMLLIVLFMVTLKAIRAFWHKRNSLLVVGDEQSLLLLAGFTASVSGALFHAGISAIFIAPGSMLVGLFVLIGFWSLIQPQFAEPEMAVGHKPSPTYVIVSVLIGIFVVAMWLCWAREVVVYYEDMRTDEPYYQQHGFGGTYPRFWFHGNFPRPNDQMP